MTLISQALYPGTPIYFFPLWLVQAWRVLLWTAELSLIGSAVVFFPAAIKCRRKGEPIVDDWIIPLYAAAVVVLARAALVQIESWNSPLAVEGMPVTTIFVLLCLYARHVRRHDRIY